MINLLHRLEAAEHAARDRPVADARARELLGPDHPELAGSLKFMAAIAQVRGEDREARKLLDRYPEIAGVGRTEEQLKEEGTPYRKGVFFFRANSRARAVGRMIGVTIDRRGRVARCAFGVAVDLRGRDPGVDDHRR